MNRMGAVRRNVTRKESLYAILVVTLLLFGAARASAQGIAAPSSLQAILEQGQSLEQNGKWHDVIRLYENAIREHPSDLVLADKLTVARVHYDISRRYRDHSFVREQLQLSAERALGLYTEVLNKIDAYYVDRPQWSVLVERGLRHIDIALADPDFRRHHPTAVNAQAIADYQRAVKSRIDVANIERVSEAREAAWVASHLAHHYLGIAPQAGLLEFTAAATNNLDKYSSYLTPSQLEEVFSQIDGNFVGLGLELKASGDALEIVQVIPGGPAAKAGISAGDQIIAIDGIRTSANSLDDDADRLKGKSGTRVELTIRGRDGGVRNLQVARRRVDVPSVDRVQILDPKVGIGYMRIVSFQKTTSRDVDEALWKLHRQGMRSLIVDLRGNPGGLLTAAVDLADKFLEQGTIVSTRGRSPREDYTYVAHTGGTWSLPLYVLIDHNSASASEIFAGAIADHQRGAIIGERSYGKGSVQGIFPLGATRCGLRLTTAKFYSPSGRAISHAGVTPNVLVRTAAKPAGEEPLSGAPATDAALRTALDRARTDLQRQAANQ